MNTFWEKKRNDKFVALNTCIFPLCLSSTLPGRRDGSRCREPSDACHSVADAPWLGGGLVADVGLAAVLGDQGVDVGNDFGPGRGHRDGGQGESVLVGRHVGVEGLD
ncbi:hypothetical protein RHSIM_Rhsim05G0033500 [Rhododendron simsii]|uniref:Uncharacterized protein n=1 Tax=Rhododendron simsii TaxID=118357 RepID=A0A834GXK1_RHOSS|nr:hypothetical protein RHSIM_Rhsim05G0033500 [Rhododendron simsii]